MNDVPRELLAQAMGDEKTHENICFELYGMKPRSCSVPFRKPLKSGPFELVDKYGDSIGFFDTREDARTWGVFLFVNHKVPNAFR